MDVSSFFNRLRQPAKPAQRPRQKPSQRHLQAQDDIEEFERTWVAVKETLEQPDERQIIRGIKSTSVPQDLQHLVDALVYESNRLDEDETGPCFEYFLRNDVLAQLERLCEQDRPHGIKAEVLKAINNLVVLLSDRFLMHNAVHRPIRRLLRSCVGDEPTEVTDGTKRLFGAASLSQARLEGAESGYDAELVDLMCILCAKMRAHPTLLLIFFHDKNWLSSPDSDSRAPSLLSSTFEAPHRPFSPSPSTRTGLSDPSTRHSNAQSRPGHRFEFLLFSYMLRFVHREGRTGDFARAGLLFLFDIAFVMQNEDTGDMDNTSLKGRDERDDPLQMARNALAEFILDGDFADVMAAAVGAVYSLLPRKVRVPALSEQNEGDEVSGGAYLGKRPDTGNVDVGSDSGDVELPSTQDQEVYEQLDLLLKLFGLIQDIVNRCTSLHTPIYAQTIHQDENEGDDSLMQALGYAIADSILDAMHRSLLDNVLYPSILECSPTDGSSVAVMTYLDILLRNMDDGPLLSRFLDYLLDLENQDPPLMEDLQRPKAGSDRFTIKDLILDNLKANVPEAQAAAARLVRTLTVDHCAYASRGLLSTISIPNTDGHRPSRSSSSISAYNAILVRLDPSAESFERSPAFSTYFTDMHTQLSADRCLQLANLHNAFLSENDSGAISKIQRVTCAHPHRIAQSDAVTQAMMEQLEAFLGNDVSQNVALTGALLGLGLCGNRSLEGLLIPKLGEEEDVWASLKHNSAGEAEIRSDASSGDFFIEDHPDEFSSDVPAVLAALRAITEQIASIRREIADFDTLLAERRRALLSGENIDEALNAAIVNDLEDSPLATATPRKDGLAKSRSEAITPVPKKGRVSLAGSIKDFFSPKKKAEPVREAARSEGENAAPTEEAEGLRHDSTGTEQDHERVPRTPSIVPLTSTSLGRKVTLTYFGGPDRTEGDTQERTSTRTVDLDTVLDNTVILEEWVKEIMGLLMARRTCGVD